MVDELSGEKPSFSVLAAVRKGISLCAALLSIALCGYFVFLSFKAFGNLNDFPQYHAAARLIAEGRAADVYKTASIALVERSLHPDMQRPLAMFLPPPAALYLLPIALFPPGTAFFAWMAALISALIASLCLIKRAFQVPSVGMGWLVAAVFSFGPAFEALRISQPATLMLLALMLSYVSFRRGKTFLSGAFLGLLLIKPQELLPLVIFFLACRQWKLIGGLAAVTAVMTMISLIIFGITGFQNYIHLLLDPTSADFMQSVINPTVRGQLGLVFGIDAQVTKYGALGALLLALVACAVVGDKARTMTNPNPYYVALVVAVPIALVTAWHCHYYDLVLLVPGLAALFLVADARCQTFLTLPIIAGALPNMIPIYVPVHYFYLLKGGTVNPYFGLLIALTAGTLFLFLTGKMPMPDDQQRGAESLPAGANNG